MSRRAGGPQSSLAANPVLVGAATVLVVLVGVFLAYNANSGLPFVPTYKITAVVPDAAELVPGNDVRIGGKRVGVVAQLTAHKDANGHVSAHLEMKLEKALEPLAIDTKVTVRPRSPLGLKYVELIPGQSRTTVPAGGSLPERDAQPLVDLDEALNTFDAQVRKGQGEVVTTFADGLAGRGADLNRALASFAPLLEHLQPVMRALRSRSADLRGFIDGLTGAAVAVDPVASTLPALIDTLTTTLEAVSRADAGLRDVLDLAPSTARQGTTALGIARPVLQDAATLATALRPGTRLLAQGTRRLADVVETATPVLRRGTTLGPDLEKTLKATGALAADPITSTALTQLTSVVAGLEPTLRTINPFQTNCNYIGLFARNASDVISEGDATGNWFRFLEVPQVSETLQSAAPAPGLHVTPYGVGSNGECETGNESYVGTQVIGHPEGVQPDHTVRTTIPAGVSQTP